MLCGYFGIALSILTLIIEVNTGSLYLLAKKHSFVLKILITHVIDLM